MGKAIFGGRIGKWIPACFYMIIFGALSGDIAWGGTGELYLPELRAVSILDDSVIHSDWNYLGLYSYTSDTDETVINGVSVTKTFTPSTGNFIWSSAGASTDIAVPSASGLMANIFQHSISGAGLRTMTVKDLVPGEYYTLQFFTSDTQWEAQRYGTFAFSGNSAGTNDRFAYYSAATAAPLVNTAITLNQKNLSASFTDATNPMSVEYSFLATSDTFKLSLNSLDNSNTWHVYGLALAQRSSNPLTALTLNGTLENVGGKLVGSAFASYDGAKVAMDVNWKLEMATSLDGERVTLSTGTSAFGDFGTAAAVKGNIFEALQLDPGFEAAGAGEASAWQIVKSGMGEPVYVTTFDGGNPFAGKYAAYPGQTTHGNRDFSANGDYPGIIRSGEFELTGDAISFKMWGGTGTTTGWDKGVGQPLRNENDVSGYLGVAIRDVATGDYVAFQGRGTNDGNWQTITFTDATIAALMSSGITTVTLDLIDEFYAGWGWGMMDDFQMLGNLPVNDSAYYFLSIEGWEDIAVFGPGLNGGTTVPEPATWLMLLAGAVGMGMARKRRK